MDKLYATYHKLEFRPPKKFITTDESISKLCDIIGINSNELMDRSYSAETNKRQNQERTVQFKTVDTFNRQVDFEFTNSPKHGRCLNRLTLQGKAFEELKLDIGYILTRLEEEGFEMVEAHSRVLIPHDFVSWEVIEQHFRDAAYTSQCRIVSPLRDPQNDYATTWQAGKLEPSLARPIVESGT
jgi:hypothetical protein